MSAGDVLLAVPNISEGRDAGLVADIAGTEGLLDVHSDAQHHRSVLTYGGRPGVVTAACEGMLVRAIERLDLGPHTGSHPRFGVVDVLPFVPYVGTETTAIEAAGRLTELAASGELPVYHYDRASPNARTLPELRRLLRSGEPPPPDAGPPLAHPTAGVVCIGVRGPLVAFNVYLRPPAPPAAMTAAAARLRTFPGIRALAFPELHQLSMNLVDPDTTGPAQAFAAAREVASELELEVTDSEVVGLVPGRLAAETTTLPLRSPARSVEDALSGA